MLPAIDLDTGHLPLGRYLTTLDQLEERYVTGQEYDASTTRQGIWNDFLDVTKGLRGMLPVCYVWVSGSFISSKLNPEDIDVMYWCEDVDFNRVRTSGTIVEQYVLQTIAQSRLRSVTGHRVDSRIGRWHARPETGLLDTPEHHAYARSRGFWDDFWMRIRSGEKGDPPVRLDALPRRGYVEVTLDGCSHE
ncbi:DUF6932 family protein [Agromyces sp. NPDC055658]